MTIQPKDLPMFATEDGTTETVAIEIVYCDKEGQPARRRRMPLTACLGAMPRAFASLPRAVPSDWLRARS